MRTAQQPNTSSTRTSARGQRGWPTVVATEVLLLRPHGETERPEGREESALWPLFVMVVTEPTDPVGKLAQPLFDLLDRHTNANELLVVSVESAWSVLDPANALLALTVRAADPISLDLRIVLPAAPVLDILDMVARGTPIGITTRERAERLRGRVDGRTAVRDVVLLSSLPSAEPAALADALRTAREA
ncbi:hypothetical protein [Actinophytocola glycyrrhizae]|uniref:Uncharacterized protein n=1 Tax=Actinophytocola glycyrrhizae TaxID=2044873 RepID=A0ABV9SAY0_9PSEU